MGGDTLGTALRGADRKSAVWTPGWEPVMALDATGLHRLQELHRNLRWQRRWRVLSGPHTRPLRAMSDAGSLGVVGTDNVCETLDQALEMAGRLLRGPDSGAGIGWSSPVALGFELWGFPFHSLGACS